MPTIQAIANETGDSWSVRVTVQEGSDQTQHIVEVPKTDYETLTAGQVPVEQLIEASFQFLLEHEPKEAILSRFDIMTIAHYFPNYPGEIQQRLEIS